MRYRRAYEQPWGGSRLRCEFLMLKYAIYWQFVLLCSDAVMPVSLCRNFWLCHSALFPVCVLFWLDLVTFCWCDASWLAERSICWRCSLLFFLFRWFDFMCFLCCQLHMTLHENWCAVPCMLRKTTFNSAQFIHGLRTPSTQLPCHLYAQGLSVQLLLISSPRFTNNDKLEKNHLYG